MFCRYIHPLSDLNSAPFTPNMTPGYAFISECPVPSAQLFMVKLLKCLKRTRTLPSHEADSPTPTPLLIPSCEARNSLDSSDLYHPTPSEIYLGTTKKGGGRNCRGSPRDSVHSEKNVGYQGQTDLSWNPGCLSFR